MSTSINKYHDFSKNKDFFTYDKQHYFNNNHKNIIDRLNYFLEMNQIPNMIFYGDNGVGKKYILKYFINKIYDFDNDSIKNNTLIINCCHGKGNIKFIREDLKLFSNSIITKSNAINIKCVLLINADYLTIDAQSALRRSIELYNKTTRFFIVVNNYEKLIKPIISRFCSIYIINPVSTNRLTNYYKLIKNEQVNYYKINYLKKHIKSINVDNYNSIIELCNELYNKGYSSIDITKYVEHSIFEDSTSTSESEQNYNLNKYKLLTIFENIDKEFRNEKLEMFFILNYVYFRYNYDLKI